MLETVMAEDMETEQIERGGVMSLLRMAKVRCGAAVAFSALRAPDGTLSIAAYPDPTATLPGEDAEWSLPVLSTMVSGLWGDPGLGEDPFIARHLALPEGTPGVDTELSVAAVALAGETDTAGLWGLLGVANPVQSPFHQPQLGTLADLGHRLTAYLRAREEVLSAAPTAPAEGPRTAKQGPTTPPAPVGAEDTSSAPSDSAGSGQVPASGGRVALILFELRSPSAPSIGAVPAPVDGLQSTIVEALDRRLRESDSIFPAGPGITAVIVHLPADPPRAAAAASAVQERLLQVARGAVAAAVPADATWRSAMALGQADDLAGTQDLLHEAWTNLEPK